LQADQDEYAQIRASVAKKDRTNSNRALAFMLLVWAAAIGVIFWHVWRTLARGLQSMASADEIDRNLPASTLIFNAFKAQLRGNAGGPPGR
jgi:hypothetical protein